MHYFNTKRVFIYEMMMSTLQQNFLLGFFPTVTRGRVEPSSHFWGWLWLKKNVRSHPECCFRWWNRAKIEPKGDTPPPEDGWERFSWIVFISRSLLPDLTSGLKGVSRVRQKCGESEHQCAYASVSGACTWVPHVILRWRAVVPAAGRSPQVHKSHLSLMCVYDSAANTCYQSAPVRAAWRRVDGFTRPYAHMWTRTCAQTGRDQRKKAGGDWFVNGGHCKAEDGGKKTRNKRWRPKKTNGKIRYKETGSKQQTYRSDAKWRVWNWEKDNEDRLLQEPTQHRFQQECQEWPSFHSQLLSFSDIIVFLYINLHVRFFPLFPPFLSSPSLRTSASHRMLLLSLLKAKENQISPLNHSYFNGKQPDIKKKGGLEMERMGE